MDLAKASKIQMYFWFGATGVTLIMVAILYFQDSIESWYFLVPVICFAVALMRRWLWLRLEKSMAERDGKDKNKAKKKK